MLVQNLEVLNVLCMSFHSTFKDNLNFFEEHQHIAVAIHLYGTRANISYSLLSKKLSASGVVFPIINRKCTWEILKERFN